MILTLTLLITGIIIAMEGVYLQVIKKEFYIYPGVPVRESVFSPPHLFIFISVWIPGLTVISMLACL